MREIKFRGYSQYHNKWFYGNLIKDKYGHALIIRVENVNKIEDGKHIFNTPQELIVIVDPRSVGEYTGFKDKNDKDIYEYDIVGANNATVGRVEFIDGRYVINNGEDIMSLTYANIRAYNFEVIGVDRKKNKND